VKTKIEWADLVCNPIIGCSPISEGCAKCYARNYARRLAGMKKLPHHKDYLAVREWDGSVKFRPDVLSKLHSTPPGSRVFLVSMGDLFHANVPNRIILSVLATIKDFPKLTFMVLTKRAQRMHDLLTSHMGKTVLRPNLWLGVTCETQARANERIPALLTIPTPGIRFVSFEPLLEKINLLAAPLNLRPTDPKKLHWMIAGAETGRSPRLMDPKWALSIKDQARSLGAHFFIKKMSHGRPIPKQLDKRSIPLVPCSPPVTFELLDCHDNWRCSQCGLTGSQAQLNAHLDHARAKP
jgi:protein gp37